MAQYISSSPYFLTQTKDDYLDTLVLRQIPKEQDDILFIIKAPYIYRPDLLAADLYGNSNLWWVFAVRNPNSIEDPIFDFIEGKAIYLPKAATLTRVLGL